MKNRLILVENIKMWINKLTSIDSFSMDKLKPYNGDELDKMTNKELKMILDYIVVAYHCGSQGR